MEQSEVILTLWSNKYLNGQGWVEPLQNIVTYYISQIHAVEMRIKAEEVNKEQRNQSKDNELRWNQYVTNVKKS